MNSTGGGSRIVQQCGICGGYGPRGYNAIKADELRVMGRDPAAIKPFDEAAFAASEKALHRRSQIAYLRELTARREARAPYYDSPEWQRKRELVFKRSGGMCEGCGERRATQAHHDSYDHFGDEFLWELYAVCDECHERWHADHKDAETELREALDLTGDETPF